MICSDHEIVSAQRIDGRDALTKSEDEAYRAVQMAHFCLAFKPKPKGRG